MNTITLGVDSRGKQLVGARQCEGAEHAITVKVREARFYSRERTEQGWQVLRGSGEEWPLPVRLGVNQREILARLFLRGGMNTTVLLDGMHTGNQPHHKLERAGLIFRRAGHGRRILWYLTEEGWDRIRPYLVVK